VSALQKLQGPGVRRPARSARIWAPGASSELVAVRDQRAAVAEDLAPLGSRGPRALRACGPPGRRPSFSAVERRGSRGGRTCREEVGTPEDARVRLNSSWMSCLERGRPVGDVGLREWAAARGDRRSQRPNRPGCGGWPRAGGRAAGRRRGTCGAPADAGQGGPGPGQPRGPRAASSAPCASGRQDARRPDLLGRGLQRGHEAATRTRGHLAPVPPHDGDRHRCLGFTLGPLQQRLEGSAIRPRQSFNRWILRYRIPDINGRTGPRVHAVHATRLSIIPSSSSPHRGRHAPPPLTMRSRASRTSSSVA
jgi:hypothetical protein